MDRHFPKFSYIFRYHASVTPHLIPSTYNRARPKRIPSPQIQNLKSLPHFNNPTSDELGFPELALPLTGPLKILQKLLRRQQYCVCNIVQYCAILCNIAQYCAILCNIVQYCACNIVSKRGYLKGSGKTRSKNTSGNPDP